MEAWELAVSAATLLVTILILLSVQDLDALQRRLQTFGLLSCLAVITLFVLLVLAIVMAIVDRYLSIPEGWVWYLIGGLGGVAIVVFLFDFRQERNRKAPPSRKHDPGDYKLGI